MLDLIPYFGDIVPWGTAEDVNWASFLFAGLINDIATVTGWINTPVQAEMNPFTEYVGNTMNGATEVAGENANIEVEGSVVFTTDPDGAVLRFVNPGSGDSWATVLDATGYTLIGAAAYLYVYGDPDDPFVMDAANRFNNLGTDFLGLDAVWCSAITASFGCLDSDGLVPVWSQVLGRGFNVQHLNSPIHTIEPLSGFDYLSPVFQGEFGYQ